MTSGPEPLLTRGEAERIVAEGARRYFESRRARVNEFVQRHFSFSGSLSMHRKAVGWDMLKGPVNIALAVPQLATKLAAAGAKAIGADKASEYLGSRNLMFDTDLGQEIEWLIITELLELPFQQGGRVSQRDALAETILAAPELQERLQQSLEVIGRKGDDLEFRARLEASMEIYAGTRAAAAEIAASLMTVGAGAVALQKVTPGVMSLGPALAAALAQNAAVASFPLGASAGGLWYGLFPAAVSPVLVGGVTGGLLAITSVAAAFAGIITDPVQKGLGLHHRRLTRLIDALEKQWNREHEDAEFKAHDPYVARLMDVFDILGAAYRIARS
ncbi:DUF6635 family protein [Microvirga lotononidis]|uniref:Uncharacterized protein n=1 Tax=Microvirga lotononidis TaxID=864069 RepID=I4Z1C8_9HYPH|nr:DUF6635 family protein [Microvirga lotononidis]EIM30020.1 hypothetical protein MicloDRAFT_00013410 [Microvirga lotononidis]WQO31931.1 DUF6635 family protein [Microvirga lotononidis]